MRYNTPALGFFKTFPCPEFFNSLLSDVVALYQCPTQKSRDIPNSPGKANKKNPGRFLRKDELAIPASFWSAGLLYTNGCPPRKKRKIMESAPSCIANKRPSASPTYVKRWPETHQILLWLTAKFDVSREEEKQIFFGHNIGCFLLFVSVYRPK